LVPRNSSGSACRSGHATWPSRPCRQRAASLASGVRDGKGDVGSPLGKGIAMTTAKPAITVGVGAGAFTRRIDGADFSLEANTPRVPADRAYYVLRGGEIIFRSENYPEALARYQELCQEHWEKQLEGDESTRLNAARGLYSLDAQHSRAVAILKAAGDAGDHRRLAQAAQRQAYLKRTRREE